MTAENENKEENSNTMIDSLTDKQVEEENKTDDFSDFSDPYVSNPTNVDKKENNKKKLKSFLLDLLLYGFIFFVFIYVIPNFVMQRTVVDGTSMENTLDDNDNLLIEKISTGFDHLKRFDIIVFYPLGRDYEEFYVKRIIGLPGETVQIIGSDIYINGKILKENYGKDPITNPGLAAKPIILGDDEYFVLGDNREVSDDSRYEKVGKVSRKNIEGKAFLRIWPLNKFGFID